MTDQKLCFQNGKNASRLMPPIFRRSLVDCAGAPIYIVSPAFAARDKSGCKLFCLHPGFYSIPPSERFGVNTGLHWAAVYVFFRFYVFLFKCRGCFPFLTAPLRKHIPIVQGSTCASHPSPTQFWIGTQSQFCKIDCSSRECQPHRLQFQTLACFCCISLPLLFCVAGFSNSQTTTEFLGRLCWLPNFLLGNVGGQFNHD